MIATLNNEHAPLGIRWRRARRNLMTICGAYLVAVGLEQEVVSHQLVTGTPRAFVAGLPTVLFLALIVVLVQGVRRGADEMMQRMHMQAATFAFVGTALAMTAMDGLARARLWNAPRADLEVVAAVLWSGAIVFLGWRNGHGGC